MKKVAIVGVEGSGKTVLMAVMGDKYETPDENGVFLQPVNHETYSYYSKEMANLRAGKWPLATESSVLELDWMLKRQTNGGQKQLGQLSFLDFGGEIYRRAFGDRAQGELNDEDKQRKSAVKQLKSHVQNADALIVLVNLSDIINGSGSDARTIEMNWLSQAILSYAFDKAGKTDVALVFTQADTYAQTIKQCGGVRGTLARYLKVVDTNYGDRLSLFEVAAIDKTIPDAAPPSAPLKDIPRLPVPAPGFKPQGLEPLIGWVVETIEKKRRRRGRLLFALAVLVLLGGIAAAERACPYAQCSIGSMYENGRGVEKDDAEAVKWYRKAAEQGHVRAQFNLGLCYKNGWGCEVDLKEAEKWMAKAEKGGQTRAPSILAEIRKAIAKEEATQNAKKAYNEGNYREFMRLLEEVDKSDASIQFMLGYCYDKGLGVGKDAKKAFEWYSKAVEQGNAAAMNNLGVLYGKGQGVPEDKYKALDLYKSAAEKGNEVAQCNLGRYYRYGTGCTKNLELAKKWYRKSADQGYEKAKAELAELEKGGK